jgi:hypothetical protein
MEEVEADDLALANACLEIEHEHRQRTYAAVERVLALAAGGSGKLDERLRSLPERELATALFVLYEAGWVYATPK